MTARTPAALSTLAALSAINLLSACINVPRRPTLRWLCRAEALSGHAHAWADLALDGSLILALWSWSTPGYTLPNAFAAYAGDAKARRYDTPTTGATRLPPV